MALMKARYLMHEFINCPPFYLPLVVPLKHVCNYAKNPGKLQVIDMPLHPEQTMQ